MAEFHSDNEKKHLHRTGNKHRHLHEVQHTTIGVGFQSPKFLGDEFDEPATLDSNDFLLDPILGTEKSPLPPNSTIRTN